MKKIFCVFFQCYTLEMTNKISNVNTTNPHNKVYINEAHLLVITIKQNTRKKKVIFKLHFSIFCFDLKSISLFFCFHENYGWSGP